MPKPVTAERTRPLALGYVRVSTVEQATEGASLDAQRAALTAEADRRGWDLEVIADEGASAKNLKRPALQAAIAALDAGSADYLLAIRLDRISRSVADFAGLLDRAGRKNWGLVLMSPNIDTSDAAGRFTANVLASAAQYERELIGARTREGMQQRKSEGIHLGRVSLLAESTRARILNMHADGQSFNGIAKRLTEEAVPTATGRTTWYASTVKQVIDSVTSGRRRPVPASANGPGRVDRD